MTDNDSHGLDDFRNWPEEGRVFPASSANIQVLDGPHPFCLSDADEIAANWQREVTANPALFDGQMVFHRQLRVNGGAIEGEAHVVPYSAFLWWRRKADRRGGMHLFCYPVLVSADGALIAVTMGSHTANPGQVYFAAGSLEPVDIVDGRCDMEENMRREVLEETGLDLLKCRSDAGFHAVRLDRTIALCKLYYFEETAEQIVASIEAHMEVAEDDEIAGAVIIRSADPSAYPYNAAMLPVIDWFFATVRT